MKFDSSKHPKDKKGRFKKKPVKNVSSPPQPHSAQKPQSFPTDVNLMSTKEDEPRKYKKHPRIAHLPHSGSKTSDDLIHLTLPHRLATAKRVVATVKYDGENTTIYPDGYYHARSTDRSYHPSRTHIGSLSASIAPNIPEGWRLCGENMYAVHSIEYHDLPGLFIVHSIWNEKDQSLSWDETQEWAEMLDLPVAQPIFDGEPIPLKELQKIYDTEYAEKHEGYVLRVSDVIPYNLYSESVAKYVRPHHVQTSQHWLTQKMRRNFTVESES